MMRRLVALLPLGLLLALGPFASPGLAAAGDIWSARAVAPAMVGSGGALVYPGSGDTIYAFRGNLTTDFWAHSISNNAWTTRAVAPNSVALGGALVYPGSGDTIYAFGGNISTNFWAHSISNNTWTTRAAAPAAVGDGGALVYPGSGDTIYAFRGGVTTDFWAYSISNNAWTTRAAAPDSVVSGGALVYPGSGDTIYAFRGDLTNNFWAYSISNNAWTTRAAAPAPVADGGALVYPGSGDTIYAFGGNISTNFWAYSISNNVWDTRAAPPATVSNGGALVYPGSGDTIYALGGSGTAFWAYTLPETSPPPPDTSGPNAWYVNDTSATGDSFTSALGNNANIGLTPATPKRTISSVMPLLTPGDTIYIDAGIYNETVAITQDNIALIGKDSTAAGTVLDFGDSSSATNAIGIFADSQIGLLIRDLRIQRYYQGINWNNVDSSTLEDVTVRASGAGGSNDFIIFLQLGCDLNTLRRNSITDNAGHGIRLHASSSNTIIDNLTSFNGPNGGTGGVGIAIENGSSSNSIRRNISRGNWSATDLGGSPACNNNSFEENIAEENKGSNGFVIQGAADSGNIFRHNLSRKNLTTVFGSGSFLISGTSNAFYQNEGDSNNHFVVNVTAGLGANNSFTKSNILGPPYSPDSGVLSDTTGTFSMIRNWWGTTDSQAIRNKIWGVGASLVTYIPFRLGIVDTAPGADTVAPRAPDTVVAAGLNDTGIRVTWAAVILDEEADANPTNLVGYRVYRSATANTTYWAPIATVGVVNSYNDTGLPPGATRFYRVTARDNSAFALFENESFYSDSIATGVASPDTSGPNAWYVNDTNLAGDVFATDTGQATNSGLSPGSPKRFLNDIENLLTPGDTVFVDAGTYPEPDTFTINANGVFVIGKDSVSAVIDFNDSTAAGARAIYATNVTRLTIKDLAVIRGRIGVWFKNVDTSTIERVRSDTHGQHGFSLESGSDSNTLSNNASSGNSANGFNLLSSLNNMLSNNRSSGNGTIGFDLQSSNNTLVSNTASNNSGEGFNFDVGGGNVVSNNMSSQNAGTGFQFWSASTSNTLLSNTAFNNTGLGFNIGGAGNTMRLNTADSNASNGFTIASNSHTMETNVASNNAIYGFNVTGSLNVMTWNTASDNADIGFMLNGGTNTLTSNTASNNKSSGFSSVNSTTFYTANTADSNASWAFYIDGASGPTTYQKNIILASPTRPDSGVYNNTASSFNFVRTWWGTTDSAAIRNKIWGVGQDTIIYTPFRLSIVDTAPGADTVAPALPVGVTIDTATPGQIKLQWSPPALDEEGGALTGLAGYQVYRLTNVADTNDWKAYQVNESPDTFFFDTQVTPGNVYYYRVTSHEHVPFGGAGANESFFGTIFSAKLPDTAGVALNATTSKVVDPDLPNHETGVLAFRVTASGADTVTSVGVLMKDGDGLSVGPLVFDTVTLYRDNNGNGEFDGASDTPLGVMTYDTVSTQWKKTGLSLPFAGPAGSIDFVVSASLKLMGDYVGGETMQAQVPTGGVAAVRGGTAPLSPLVSASIFQADTGVTFQDAGFLVDLDTYVSPDTAGISFEDEGINLNAGVAETVAAVVTKLSGTPDTENVILTETGVDSGFFNGTILISNVSSDSAPQNGKIFAMTGDTIKVTVAGTNDQALIVGGPPATVVSLTPGLLAGPIPPTGPDTTILAVTIAGAASDTLIGCTVTIPGSTPPGDVDTITIYIDANKNGALDIGADTFLRLLSFAGAGQYANSSVNYFMPSGKDSFVIGFSFEDTANPGDTFQSRIAANDVKLGSAGFGPPTPVIQAGVWSVAGAGPGTVVTISPGLVPGSISPPGPETGVLAFTVKGAASDTLVSCTVTLAGMNIPNADVDTVVLYVDGNKNGLFDPGTDTFVVNQLVFQAPGAYRAISPNFFMPSGAESFVVTINLEDTANPADTFQTIINQNDVTLAVAGTGPGGPAILPGNWTVAGGGPSTQVTLGAPGLVPTAINPAAPETAILSFSLSGANPDTLNSIVLRLMGNLPPQEVSSAGLRLYRDANKNARFEAGTDTQNLAIFSSGGGDTWQVGALSVPLPGGGDSFLVTINLVDTASNSDTFRARIDAGAVVLSVAGTGPGAQVTLAGVWTVAGETQTRVTIGGGITPGTILRYGPETGILAVNVHGTNPDTIQTVAIRLAGNLPLADVPSNGVKFYRDINKNALFDTGTDTFLAILSNAGGDTWQMGALSVGLPGGSDSFVFTIDLADTASPTDTFSSQIAANQFQLINAGKGPQGQVSLPGVWFVSAGDTAPPAPFALLGPVHLTETNVAAQLFSWTGSSDTSPPVTFTLRRANNAAFSAPIDTSVGTNTSALVNLTGADTVYWRVIASDALGNTTTAGDSLLFLDVASPSAFSLTTPATLSETSLTNIFFSWTASTDALSGINRYVLQVSDSFGMSPLMVDSSVGLAVNTTTALPGEDTYYWRVWAYDDAGNSVVASGNQFTIDVTMPSTPTYVAPVAGTTVVNPIWMDWNASTDTLSGVDNYNIQIDNDPAFGSPAYDGNQSFPDTFAPVLSPDTYFWRVRAQDGAGNLATGATETFVVPFPDSSPPGPFFLTAPAQGLETGASSLVFTWTAASETQSLPVTYILRRSNNPAFAGFIDSGTGAATTGTIFFGGDDTSYWRVIASDASGNTTTAGDSLVLVDRTAPSVFSLTAPANNHETSTASVGLSWTASSDAFSGLNRYQIQFSTSFLFTTLSGDTNVGLATSTVQTIGTDTLYWRVMAFDDAGNTSVTGGNQILVDLTPPTAVTFFDPTGGETKAPTLLLDWNASTDAGSGVGSYRVQVSNSVTFATNAVDTTQAFPDLSVTLPVDTYFWRVYAIDDAGNSVVSSPPNESFVVYVPPEAIPPSPIPSQISPVNAHETTATNITFSWSASSDSSTPITYRLQVSPSPSFGPITVDSTTTATNLAAVVPPDTFYYWRVNATDAVGNISSYSGNFTFTVDQQAPSPAGLFDPTAGETKTSPVTFMWNPASDALSGLFGYRLQAATDPGFTALVTDQSLGATSFLTGLTANTYWWRVYAIDDVGNSVVSSPAFETFVVSTGADTIAPLPVGNPTATPNSNGTIRLDWVRSPDNDMESGPGGRYNIYWDNASGNPNILLTFVSHVAGQVNYTFTTGVLTNGTLYAFNIRAQDGNGNENTDTNKVLATAQIVGGVPVHAVINQPMAGNNVTATQQVYVGSYIDPASELSRVANVRFDYRKDTTNPSAPWTTMTAFDPATSPNPTSNVGSGNANLYWATAALNTGPYQIRAVANLTDATGDSAPPITVINLVSNPATADQTVTQTAGTMDASFVVQPDVTYSFTNTTTGDTLAFTYTNAQDTFFVPDAQIFPDGSYNLAFTAVEGSGTVAVTAATYTFGFDGTNTAGVNFVISDTGIPTLQMTSYENVVYSFGNETTIGTVEFATGTMPNATDTLVQSIRFCSDTVQGRPGGLPGASMRVDMAFSSGDTLLGGLVPVTLSYPDDNQDGIVDGSSINENDIQLWVYSNAVGWELATGQVHNNDSNTVSGFTAHFSTFLLVGPGGFTQMSDVTVAPNPFRPNDGDASNGTPYTGATSGGIVFFNCPPRARIEVFTISGRKVASFTVNGAVSQNIRWDVKNSDNRDVASGYYIWMVTNLESGDRRTGKLAVIR